MRSRRRALRAPSLPRPSRAGFKTVARRAPPRPIMRHDLNMIGALCPYQH
jgi:hypothetical protein